MPISVNMLGLRFTNEAHMRWKKGRPPQSTTGVESASSTQASVRGESPTAAWPASMGPIDESSTGSVSNPLTQKRRVMSRSSSLWVSSALTMRGSRAMPQIGHAPGWARTTCGCMGHVYSMRPGEAPLGDATAAGAEPAYFSGLERNRSRHDGPQNQ